MKNILHSLVIAATLVILGLSANSQTNVSGGIYSNTTWTLASSPYVVTDTVVVFSGVTLTIQPGVTVKFDNNMELEIRGKLIAQGTSSDSITFTSNAASPTIGIWSGIEITGVSDSSIIKYCDLNFANCGIYSGSITIECSNFNNNSTGIATVGGNNTKIDSSVFKNNITGLTDAAITSTINNCGFYNNIKGASISGISTINYSIFNNNTTGLVCSEFAYINNSFFKNNISGIEGNQQIFKCNISKNQKGITSTSSISHTQTLINSILDSNTVYGIITSYEDSIVNCEINHNGVGIISNTGVNGSSIIQNIIENNVIGINILYNVGNTIIYCNKICNNTSYDLIDSCGININIPNNYWCTTDSAIVASHIYDGYDNINLGLVFFMPIDTIGCYLTAGIVETSVIAKNNIAVYPNPAIANLTIESPQQATIEITNIQGELIETLATTGNKTNVAVSALAKGMYFVKVKTEKGVESRKFVKL